MEKDEFECPTCTADLASNGEIVIVGTVLAAHDPEGKARFDLILECGLCNARFNAFVPVNDFLENPMAEGT